MHHDNLGIRVQLVEFSITGAIHVVWRSRRRVVSGKAHRLDGGLCRKQSQNCGCILFDAELTHSQN